MARRECESCAAVIPNTKKHICPVCGGDTKYVQYANESDDWELEIAYRQAMYVHPKEQFMRDFRRRQLEKLGFGGAFLDILSETLSDIDQARRLIGRGCDVDTAARILI